MNKFLVVGVDTVVGANLALCLSDKYQVATWHPTDKFDIAGCDAMDPDAEPASVIEQSQPDWIIYCGSESRSAWEANTVDRIDESIVAQAAEWASAAKQSNARFAMVSSDAVFSGPWMFHDEESIGECQTLQAMTIRASEQAVLEHAQDALLIRSNVFGWSADPNETCWVENLIQTVRTHRVVEQDATRHATPILATDFAAIIERACAENLSGVFHIAGAERVSPLKFAQRLADQFGLPWLSVRKETTLMAPPREFAAGETSLQTKRIRKALCVAMPLLSEGLIRLREQQENGYCERLVGSRGKGQIAKAA
ncbi:sugar nucleotide-binding protein [Thalassoglobus sp. JC818]|uniref:sugar nucleotide-binding protein n=1 Tax=Thalassoglobus sp. JC818 TaxID=3232136 RepID=UPI00345943BF